MSQSNSKIEFIISAFMLAIGLAAAGYFISGTLYKSKIALNTADVKGLAERRVEADSAYWSIEYTVTGASKSDIPKLYDESEIDQQKIISLLKESGFTETEITPGVINYHKQEFRDENQVLVEEKHDLVGIIDIQTNKVKLVSQVRSKLNKLIAQGLDITNNAPAYQGGIRTARQGGFVIRDVGERYGDTAKIEKDVRVVTNVTFLLTE